MYNGDVLDICFWFAGYQADFDIQFQLHAAGLLRAAIAILANYSL